MERETGGPAFPVGDVVERDEKGHLHGPVISSVGMTLRDYLAAKAMATLCASYDSEDAVSVKAYRFADAMLKARTK